MVWICLFYLMMAVIQEKNLSLCLPLLKEREQENHSHWLLNWNANEIGETMESLTRRLHSQGDSVETISKKTGLPAPYIEQLIA